MIFLVFYALFASTALIMVLVRPSNSLVIVYCLFVFEQWAQANHRFFLEHGTLTNMLGGVIVLCAFFVRYFKGPERSEGWSGGAIAIWALFAFAFISVAWSANFETGLALWNSKIPYLGMALLLVPWIVKESKDLMPTYQNLLIVSFVLTGLVYFTTDWTYRGVAIAEGARLQVTRGNPLEVATVGGVLVIVAVLFSKHRLFGFWGLVRLAAIILGVIVTVRTGTRGQLIASFLVVFVMMLVKNKLTSPKSLVAASFVAIVLASTINFAINHYWGDARWGSDVATQDMSGRLDMSLFMLSSWLNAANPFTIFVGLGNSSGQDLMGVYPHNVMVEILTEEGLIGFSLIIFLLIRLFSSYLERSRRQQLPADDRQAHYIAIALFLYFFILTFKQGSLLTSHAFFMSAMILSDLLNRKVVTRTRGAQRT